jgi:hypothetical protein
MSSQVGPENSRKVERIFIEITQGFPRHSRTLLFLLCSIIKPIFFHGLMIEHKSNNNVRLCGVEKPWMTSMKILSTLEFSKPTWLFILSSLYAQIP